MSPDAQRVAIAKACGWKFSRDSQVWYPPNLHPAQNVIGYTLPDYLTDLNAMHEAEKVLHGNKWQPYHDRLAMINCNARCGSYPAIDATAAQRAEAFLKTLNLWTT